MRLASLVLLTAVLGTSTAHAQTLGLSINIGDAFQDALYKGIQEHVSGLSGVTIDARGAEGDIDVQFQTIEDLLSSGVDALLVSVLDSDQGAQITQMGQDAGVPVVFFNSVPSNMRTLPDNQAVVASNEKLSGTLQTQEVCRLLGGSGDIAILMGELTHPAARTRTQDIYDVMATNDCAGLNIVEQQSALWSRDYGYQQTVEWLNAGVRMDAIIANNDEMALGAIRALQDMRQPWTQKVKVAGIDATGDALRAMAAGTLSATVLQNAPAIGASAVDTALDLIAGKDMDTLIDVPFELVTPANLTNYQ